MRQRNSLTIKALIQIIVSEDIFKMPVTFGQIVIGPPGAGKTTYCDAMSQLLRNLGREVSVLNIDPANEGETLPYKGTIR